MTPLILDETPAALHPALKETLRELLAIVPPDLLKGVRQIIIMKEVTDPRVLKASGKVSSQYLYKDGSAVIHLYLDHVDRKPRRLVPLSWRSWSRARVLVAALSYPLAHQRWHGKQRDEAALRNEARRIQVLLLRRWAAEWSARVGAGPRMKDLLRRYWDYRLRRVFPEQR